MKAARPSLAGHCFERLRAGCVLAGRAIIVRERERERTRGDMSVCAARDELGRARIDDASLRVRLRDACWVGYIYRYIERFARGE